MSLPDQEAVAMRRAWKFLLGLSSGEVKLDRAGPVRQEARDIAKHFPLGGDLAEAAKRYAPVQLGKAEREADQLAHEAAREAERANQAEAKVGLGPRAGTGTGTGTLIPPDNLNIP